MFGFSDISDDPHPVYSNLNHEAVAHGSVIIGLIVVGVVLFLFVRMMIRQLWIQLVAAFVFAGAVIFMIKHIHFVMAVFQSLRSLLAGE